jgi:hypothetical protein
MKENYRPISVLTNISIVFEDVICDQMVHYFDDILSYYLAAYRKHHSCNTVLLSFIELLRKSLDNNEYLDCLLMDLAKAFDALPHGLQIAKLEKYGLSLSACDYTRSYLTHWKQRVKLNHCVSDWKELTMGVPQGSLVGFNIFINYLCCLKASVTYLIIMQMITLCTYCHWMVHIKQDESKSLKISSNGP